MEILKDEEKKKYISVYNINAFYVYVIYKHIFYFILYIERDIFYMELTRRL